MCLDSNEKQETTHDQRNQTTKSRENQNGQRKRNLQIIGNIGSGHHQTSEMKEKNEKVTRDKTILPEPYQRDKYLSSPPRKIFGTILEVDQRRPPQMDQRTRELMTMHPKDDVDRLYVSKKKEEGHLLALKRALTYRYKDSKTTQKSEEED